MQANVNLAAERGRVRLADGADEAAVMAAVAKAGFSAAPVDSQTREREKAEKLQVYRSEIRRFWISVALTLPLVGQMFFMFGEHGHMNELPRWLQLALATPVQFWIGWRFYDGAYKALRGGGANMDVLVALGTSMAWGFSAVVTVFGLDQHVYFEGGAAVITLVLLGKLLEARCQGTDLGGDRVADSPAAENCPYRAQWAVGGNSGRNADAGRYFSGAAGRERAGGWRGHRRRIERQ
jgi:Cu+-exporting ATPase